MEEKDRKKKKKSSLPLVLIVAAVLINARPAHASSARARAERLHERLPVHDFYGEVGVGPVGGRGQVVTLGEPLALVLDALRDPHASFELVLDR